MLASNTMRRERVETIRKRFKQEWLLIAVDEMDEATTTPLKGHLIAHSPRREDMYRRETTCREHTLTIYSEDGLPQGYAAAFHGQS